MMTDSMAAQGIFAGGYAGLFSPPTMGGWMNLAQNLVSGGPADGLHFALATEAVQNKFGKMQGLERFLPRSPEYKDAVKAGLKPRFDSALLDAQDSRNIGSFVGKFMASGFAAVDFGTLVENGLVSADVAGPYLEMVRGEAEVVIEKSRLDEMLKSDKKRNGYKNYAFGSMIGGLIICVGGLAIWGVWEGNRISAPAVSTFGLVWAMASGVVTALIHDRDLSGGKIRDAFLALGALDRNRGILDKSPAA